ncbi:glycosyltransferase family 4 protein [Pontibacter pamirensis]|uniref:glycosyltransferase family 4 protein n=1 Tax=Pontibacter pamirensis TaxID=2562824 RepID=UPI00138A398E|nr:glycosyltransferase family 4 protein [Pontibacter pamirensis]
MKIFYLINTLGAGGAERSTAETAKYALKHGHQVTIIYLHKKPISIEEEIKDAGIRVIHLRASNFVKRVFALRKLLKAERPDIVHSVLFDSNVLIRVVKFFLPRQKVIQSLVNTPYSEIRIKHAGLPRYKFKIVQLADMLTARLSQSHYHAITTTVLEHYRPMFNIKKDQSFLVYRGRGENRHRDSRAAIRERLKFGNDFVFVSVGRQEFAKGHILLLQAINKLVKESNGPVAAKLIFLGREGSKSNELKRFVQAHDLSAYVSFLGFRSDVEEILVAADAFAFPSYYEGLGGALVEALAAGLPVICSDLPVLKEVIGSEEGALFVETGNSQDLAKAMQRMMADETLRARLSQYSIARYLEAFRQEDIYSQMLSMYSSVSAY